VIEQLLPGRTSVLKGKLDSILRKLNFPRPWATRDALLHKEKGMKEQWSRKTA